MGRTNGRIRAARAGWRRALTAMAACGALALAAAGCGDDGGGGGGPAGPPVVPQAALDLTQAGWTAFTAGDYPGAIAQFNAALAVSSNYIGALSGRGWCRLRQSDYAGAETDFAAAVATIDYWQRVTDAADALTGRALNAGATGDFAVAIESGVQAQALGGPFYFFPPDPTVNVNDVRIVVAEAFIWAGEYEAALEELVEIDVTVRNRVSPASDAFVTQLLEELQRLSLAN